MVRHSHDHRAPSPATAAARARVEARELERFPRAVRVRTGADGKPLVDLKMLVENIESSPERLDETLPSTYMDGLLDDGQQVRYRADGDATIAMEFEHEGVFIKAEGQVHVPVSHLCVRCLDPVRFSLKLNLSMRLAERGEDAPDADEESFVDDAGKDAIDDIDIVSYQDGVIHFDEILREQCFLELPPHPSCESPGAIVSKPCGFAEQQAIVEQEKVKWTEGRWAGLAALRDKLPSAPSKPAPQPAVASRKEPVSAPVPPALTTKPAKPAQVTKSVASKKPSKKTAKKTGKKVGATSKPAIKKVTKKAAKVTKKSKPATKKAAKKAKPSVAKKKAGPAKKKKPTKKR
jgi:uncharacterized metal-binding protein YceD (DUF177 family)